MKTLMKEIKGTKKGIFKPLYFLFFFCVFFCLNNGTEAPAKKASGAETLLEQANSCRKSLYSSSKKKKYRHNWQKCLDSFKKVYTKYPKSDQAAWAVYHSGKVYLSLYRYSGNSNDMDLAIEAFRKVVSQYPDHRLADDAQYRIGKIYYEEKKDSSQAYVEFLKVDIKFPSGDMRPKAREMMNKLAALIQKNEKKTRPKVPSSINNKSTTTRVTDIRHWSTPTYTRVVIDLEKDVKYASRLLKADPTLNKPRRLYLDLKDAHVSSDIESSITIRDGLLQRARAGQYDGKTVRVVLDINSIGSYNIFPLHDPFRIVVDVRGKEEKKKQNILTLRSKSRKGRTVRKGIRKEKKPDSSVSLARQLGLGVNRVVLDPGHGGKDPGCYLKGGIKEKDIVLKLSKIVAAKVKAQLGCEVLLTRSKDVFIPLEKRTAFANMNRADLFVSLHINAHNQKSINGLETYFLNMATDSRAVMVAARENATSEKRISDLQTILNDLMLNTKITESSKLAHEIQGGMLGNLRKKYKVKSLGVKQAPFYVLIGAEMPAILIETGFITNPTERTRLLSDRYLNRLADGIVNGLEKYINSIDMASYRGG